MFAVFPFGNKLCFGVWEGRSLEWPTLETPMNLTPKAKSKKMTKCKRLSTVVKKEVAASM